MRVESQQVPALECPAPPATVIGGVSLDALAIAGLPEADRVRAAFADASWNIEPGHDHVLATNFETALGGVSLALAFERQGGPVTCWVMTTATVAPALAPPSHANAEELRTLAAVVRAVETEEFSAGGLISLGRGLNWPGVDEEWLPEAVAFVSDEDHAILETGGTPRLEIIPTPTPMRTLAVGYRFRLPPDQTMANALVQHTVSTLPSIARWLAELQVEDPDRFESAFGDCIAALHMASHRDVLLGESAGGSAGSGPAGGGSALPKAGSGLGTGKPGILDQSAVLQGSSLSDEMDRVRRALSGLGLVMTGSGESSLEDGLVMGMYKESPVEVTVHVSGQFCLISLLGAYGFEVPVTHEMLEWIALRDPAPGFSWRIAPTREGPAVLTPVVQRANLVGPYTDERLMAMLEGLLSSLDGSARFRARFGGSATNPEVENA